MPLTIDATTTEWISVEEVKAHANITTSTNDDEIALMRDAAQEAVEGLVGPVLWRTVTQRITGSGSSTVVLNTLPVLSVTSLTYAGTGTTYTLADGGLLLDVPARGDLVATYVAGRATVPAAVRMAALITAAHLWNTQRGNAPTPLQEDQGGEFVPFTGDAVPPRAYALLEAAGLLHLPGFA